MVSDSASLHGLKRGTSASVMINVQSELNARPPAAIDEIGPSDLGSDGLRPRQLDPSESTQRTNDPWLGPGPDRKRSQQLPTRVTRSGVCMLAGGTPGACLTISSTT